MHVFWVLLDRITNHAGTLCLEHVKLRLRYTLRVVSRTEVAVPFPHCVTAVPVSGYSVRLQRLTVDSCWCSGHFHVSHVVADLGSLLCSGWPNELRLGGVRFAILVGAVCGWNIVHGRASVLPTYSLMHFVLSLLVIKWNSTLESVTCCLFI
jgi:hypothetical protein